MFEKERSLLAGAFLYNLCISLYHILWVINKSIGYGFVINGTFYAPIFSLKLEYEW